MSDFLTRHSSSLARDVGRVVRAAIAEHGVPVTVEEAEELTRRLYPRVVAARRSTWQAYAVELVRQAQQKGVEITPTPPGDYPPKALFDAIVNIARLAPGSNRVRVDLVDEDTGRLVSTPVFPGRDTKFDAQMMDRIGKELSGRLTRHVKQAGRDVFLDAPFNDSARYTDGRSGSPRVGYARVLSGKENCAFCVMLASRGAVYQESTVVTRRDGRRFHDGCDCVPVLVVEGKSWVGEAEAAALYERWKQVTWRDGKPGSRQWEDWKAHVKAGGVDAKAYSPFSAGKNNPVAKVLAERARARDRIAGVLVDLPGMSSEDARGYVFSRYGRGERLSAEEREVVKFYTLDGHEFMNRAERESKGKQPFDKRKRDLLDSAIDRMPPLEEPVRVVRQMWIEELEGSVSGKFKKKNLGSLTGQELTQYGYMSTSVEPQEGFGNIRLYLDLPPGQKALYVGRDKDGKNALSSIPEEDEILLPRQTRYRITRVETIDDGRMKRTELYAEVVE